MVLRGAARAGVGDQPDGDTVVGGGERRGQHTAVGGHAAQGNLAGAADRLRQFGTPLAERRAGHHGVSFGERRRIVGQVVHRVVGRHEELRPHLEVADPCVDGLVGRHIPRVDDPVAVGPGQGRECLVGFLERVVGAGPVGPFAFGEHLLPVDDDQPLLGIDHRHSFPAPASMASSCRLMSARCSANAPISPMTSATMTPRLADAQLPSLPPSGPSR